MILDAGALIVPCFRQTEPLLVEKQSLHQLNAFASMWAALENVLIAAASEGVFGVTKIISTPQERDHVRGTLGIPGDYEIPCYLALGYPRDDTVRAEQLPVDIDARIRRNAWAGEAG